MSIDRYTTVMICIYGGLFSVSVLVGIVELIWLLWNRIRKRNVKYWHGLIPCTILYSISAVFGTFVACIAYDDPADPNYFRYAGWTLHDFILRDIKTFIIWLVIGVLLYFAWKRKWTEKLLAAGCVLLGCVIALILLMVLLSAVHQ